MPAITRTKQVTGDALATEVTLTGTGDAFTFIPRIGQVLVLRNPTAGLIACTIDGDGGSTVPVPGVGSVDVSAGYTFNVGVSAVRIVWLDSIAEYLRGTISVSGTGLVAILVG